MATAGGYGYPPSKNMYQVGYSCKAEEYAMVLRSQLPAPTHPIKNLCSIPIAAFFEQWWNEKDFDAFINSSGVYDPTFSYSVFSQMISGFAVAVGCTDTCYGERKVYCAYEVCTAMTYFCLIYEVGSGPCMADSDCTTYPGSTCNAENGLCVKKPDTPLCPSS